MIKTLAKKVSDAPRAAQPGASAPLSAVNVRMQHENDVNPANREERSDGTVVVLLLPEVRHATASNQPAA